MAEVGPDFGRHMAKSAAYSEDAFARGHSSVWGSSYCRETGTWGYACCAVKRRDEPCPRGLVGESCDEAASPKVELAGAGESLAELSAAAGEITLGAELVRRFIAASLKEWHEQPDGGEGGTEGKAPPAAALQPLVNKVQALELGAEALEKLEHTCRASLDGDHLRAQQLYLDMAIGRAKWVLGGMSYTNCNERAESFGANARTRDIKQTDSLLDDGRLKVSLQGFKRLLTFMEGRRPRR